MPADLSPADLANFPRVSDLLMGLSLPGNGVHFVEKQCGPLAEELARLLTAARAEGAAGSVVERKALGEVLMMIAGRPDIANLFGFAEKATFEKARGVYNALPPPAGDAQAVGGNLRRAAIEAIALLDVAIAGTVFTKPDRGRIVVNVARAQTVLDGLRAALRTEEPPVGGKP